MYRIEGHEYVQARDANRVALYIGTDVRPPHGVYSPRDIAETVDALAVGESVTLDPIPWQGRTPRPVTVTRVAA